MKIAVISDIHGNIDALNAVMKDIEEQNCEKVFVLGDYAMAGAEPQKTIEWFMGKQNDRTFSMIQGNTDLMITDYTDDLYENLKTKAPIMAEALKYNVKTISNKAKAFLKNLPAQAELEIDGVKILLVHGSPRRNNEDILPNMPIHELEQIVEGVNASLVLCGHTHIPCGYQTENKISVVNAGSVGRPFTETPDSCYLKLTIENGECLFEHRFVKYDKESAANKLKSLDFEGSDKLAGMLLNPTVRHF